MERDIVHDIKIDNVMKSFAEKKAWIRIIPNEPPKRVSLAFSWFARDLILYKMRSFVTKYFEVYDCLYFMRLSRGNSFFRYS